MEDWKEELREILRKKELAEAQQGEGKDKRMPKKKFIEDVVVPAFEELAEELKEVDRDVDLEYDKDSASLTVYDDDREEFYYEIKVRAYKKRDFVFPVIPIRDDKGQTYRAEVFLRKGPLYRDVTNFSKEEIQEHFTDQYKRQLQWEL